MGRFDQVCDIKQDPHFFDVAQLPWVAHIEAHTAEIRQELEQYLSQHGHSLIPYFGDHLMSKKHCWRALGLKFWNIYHPLMVKQFPRTMAIFDAVPHLTAVSFSQLQPHSQIMPHYGDTNANYRCHLGLVIPAGLPDCGFRVGDDLRPWREGKVLAFCDAHQHTAFNNTDQPRFIVNFDVLRPEFADREVQVCAKALAAIMTQKVWQRMPIVKQSPLLTRIAYNVLCILMWLPAGCGIGAQTVYRLLADDDAVELQKDKQPKGVTEAGAGKTTVGPNSSDKPGVNPLNGDSHRKTYAEAAAEHSSGSQSSQNSR